METTITTNQTEVKTPEQIKAEKLAANKAKKEAKKLAADKAKQEERINITFAVGKGSTETKSEVILLNILYSEIGRILAAYHMAFSFRFFNKLINVPALSFTTNGFKRSETVYRKLVDILTNAENPTEATKSEKAIIVLKSFQAKGWKFSTYCHKDVATSFTIWAKNKKSKLGVIEAATKNKSARLIAETENNLDLIKSYKEDTAQQITGIKAKLIEDNKVLFLTAN